MSKCLKCEHDFGTDLRGRCIAALRDAGGSMVYCGCECVFTAAPAEPLQPTTDPPRCPKCGYVMCQQFDSRPVNAIADIATPNGKYVCYQCTPLQPTSNVIRGWITGNQYRERGRYEGSKAESGEPWYISDSGMHWSAFDVQFFPDHEFHGVPHRNDPNLLLCDFVFHNRRCDSTKEWHDSVSAELTAPPLQPTGEQEDFSLLSVLKAAANYIILPEQMEQLSPGAREVIIKGLTWAIHEAEKPAVATTSSETPVGSEVPALDCLTRGHQWKQEGNKYTCTHCGTGVEFGVAATADRMPRLPFICGKCNVQQHADGICANCGADALRARPARRPIAGTDDNEGEHG